MVLNRLHTKRINENRIFILVSGSLPGIISVSSKIVKGIKGYKPDLCHWCLVCMYVCMYCIVYKQLSCCRLQRKCKAPIVYINMHSGLHSFATPPRVSQGQGHCINRARLGLDQGTPPGGRFCYFFVLECSTRTVTTSNTWYVIGASGPKPKPKYVLLVLYVVRVFWVKIIIQNLVLPVPVISANAGTVQRTVYSTGAGDISSAYGQSIIIGKINQ